MICSKEKGHTEGKLEMIVELVHEEVITASERAGRNCMKQQSSQSLQRRQNDETGQYHLHHFET